MSPTSIGEGGEYHNTLKGTMQAGAHISRLVPKGTSVASLKGQVEALSIDKAGTMAL